MIIVIRGTNGSGKSHTVRRILALGWLMRENLPERSCVIRISRVTRPVLVIGPYEKGRSMGGCDCIRQPSRIYSLIEWAESRGFHAILEGVILATRPYLDFHEQGLDVRYIFLNPPFIQCLRNIRWRQIKKGHASTVSQASMHRKQERAQHMLMCARALGMPAKQFDESSDAVRWILRSLRNA
jgi:hypothetical protein